MNKTTTTYPTFGKKVLKEKDMEPGELVISTILNYSKALSVIKLKKLSPVEFIKN